MPRLTRHSFLKSIGAFDTEMEAKNLMKYIKSKFSRALLSILKITQDNPPLKWAHIPRTSEEVPDANRFGDDFWECVRAIYESNPKMTHRQLKDLVQNELQISDFPTHQALAKRAKLEGWEHADEALKKSDLTLQKQANCIKIKIKQQKIIDKNNDNNQFDDYVEDDYAAHIRKIVEAEETRFKNVTMNAI